MNKVILPLGKKPLPVIRRVRDAVDQIEDYAKLLEWLLVIHVSGPGESEDLAYLGDHVQRHASKFSNIRFVNSAIGIYNGIKHAKPAKDRSPPTEGQIHGAAQNLEKAVLEILPYVPEPVRRAVTKDPRFAGIPPKLVGAAAFLFVVATIVFLMAKADDFGKPSRQVAVGDDPERRLGVAKQQQARADKLAKDAVAALDELERETAKWNSFAASLLANDAGKRLAQADEAVRAAAALLSRPRIAPDDVKAMRQKVAATIEPIRVALRDKHSDLYPSEAVFRELEQVPRRAWEGANACKEDAEKINGLLVKHTVAVPGGKTLQQAISDLQQADALAKAAAEQKAAEESERRRTERAKAAGMRKQAFEKKLAEDRAEYQRLRALASDSKVQEQFSPFLNAGTRFPYRDYKGVRWQNQFGRQKGPPGPIGYDWLTNARVLASVEDMVAVGTSTGNDRGTWSGPSTEAEWQMYRERFQLLTQVAPIWHDMGLLGPRPEKPHVPDPDELAANLEPFQGEWRERKEDYDVLIVGNLGITTRSGKAANPVGGDMLRIEKVNDKQFHGSHYFQDGSWLPVTGMLTNPDQIRVTTDSGYSWVMERIPIAKVP